MTIPSRPSPAATVARRPGRRRGYATAAATTAYDRGMSTEQAVERGISTTAGVVTSAAIVMVGVFFVFALMPLLDMKEMGIGLAAAVLIDATIVRAVLLPASMKLLGDWNWYLPRWLEWLPRPQPAPPRKSV